MGKGKKILIGCITNNPGKFAEFERFLAGTDIQLRQVKVALDEIQETNPEKVIAHKVREAIKKGHKNFILEDTSLYIGGMSRLPGPLIKWFLAELKNPGLAKLAARMGNKTAKAETIIALTEKGCAIRYFRGATYGKIVSPKGRHDFGWGPAFLPRGAKKTFGQMLPHEKHRWSMRIKALKKLKRFLARTPHSAK